jgi:hypothetical protein
VKATDDKGQVTLGTTTLTMNVLPTVPAVQWVSPASGSTFVEGSSITLSATASEPNVGVDLLYIYNDSTLLAGATPSLGVPTKSLQWTWFNVSAGTYSVTAQATSQSGLTSTSSPVMIYVTSRTPTILGFDSLPSIVSRSTVLHLNVSGTVTQLQWTFTSGNSVGAGSLASISGSQANGPSYTAATQAPHLSLMDLPISLGPQNLTVVAYNGSAASTPFSVDFTIATSDLSSVKVHPSPWRRDLHTGHDITFDGLPANSTIKIFTVSGRWVTTISNASGQANWNLRNGDGDMVASGLYIYLVTDSQGNKAHGKFGIIR